MAIRILFIDSMRSIRFQFIRAGLMPLFGFFGIDRKKEKL
jgi:hypothetical protein